MSSFKARTLQFMRESCELSKASSPVAPGAESTTKTSIQTQQLALPSNQVLHNLIPLLPKFVSVMKNDQGEAAISSPSSSKTTDQNVYAPCCRQCGSILHPGYLGTTVRVTTIPAQSRARRRRASRKRLILKSKPKQSETVHSRLWQFCKQDAVAAKGTIAPIAGKNRLLLKCGHCNGRYSVVAIERTPKSKVETLNQSPKTVSPQKRKGDAKKNDILSQNFISLKDVEVPERKRIANTSKIDSRPRKKKKVANSLVNFLSSLNDR